MAVVVVVRSVSIATVRLHMGHMDGTVVIMMVVISTDRYASESTTTARKNCLNEHRKAD